MWFGVLDFALLTCDLWLVIVVFCVTSLIVVLIACGFGVGVFALLFGGLYCVWLVCLYLM